MGAAPPIIGDWPRLRNDQVVTKHKGRCRREVSGFYGICHWGLALQKRGRDPYPLCAARSERKP